MEPKIVIAGIVILAAVAFAGWLGKSSRTKRSKPGSLAWEAELTKSPLMLTIAERVSRKGTTNDPAKRAALEAEIDFLSKQVDEIERVAAQAGTRAGRGYVGFDVFGSATSSWSDAMSKNPST